MTLELGGNAAVIVHADADVAYAAERVAFGGFGYAGQSCISAQRIYVHAAIYDTFAAEVVRRANLLVAGDPLREDADLGPVIDDAAADRIGTWIDEATAAGARVLAGGTREGAVWRPTVIEGAPQTARVNCAEVFAPLVSLTRYDDVHAGDRAPPTSGDFGLQAGIFTHDERIITRRDRWHRRRRDHDQRHVDVPRGSHAVRRREAVRIRAGRGALRDRRNDRDEAGGL